jgi:acetylornithine deacetylase
LRPANFRRSNCIALTADQELGCIGASKLVALRPIALKHVVVGEPTSLYPAPSGKGYCLAIRVYGKDADSAHTSEGVSAIHRAAHLVLKIEEIGARLSGGRHDAFDPPFTTANIGKIQVGTDKNIVAGECRLLLEWAPLPKQDTRQVVARSKPLSKSYGSAIPTSGMSSSTHALSPR